MSEKRERVEQSMQAMQCLQMIECRTEMTSQLIERAGNRVRVKDDYRWWCSIIATACY